MSKPIFVLLSLLPSAALAYETVPVERGGRVVGVVRLTGDPEAPGAAAFPKDLNPEDEKLCGSKRPLITPYYITGPRGGLAHVAVWLEGVKGGKPREKAMGKMINEDCRFVPHVQTLDVGAKIQIENRDPILHTTHAIYRGRRITAFNVGTPRKGQKVRKKLRRPGLLRVQCDSGHVWMRAWIHAFRHPYHTVTGEDGRFVIDEIPPGAYTLRVWHELGGILARAVEVEPGENRVEDLAFEAKPLPEDHAMGIHSR